MEPTQPQPPGERERKLAELFRFSQKIAAESGKILMRHFGQNQEANVIDKSPTDFALQADLEVDAYLHEVIGRTYPDHRILSEERDSESIDLGTEEFVWVIDPLDGTTPFRCGKEDFSVSIGLVHRGEPLMGVIYAPKRKEMYTAQTGKGAWLVRSGGARERLVPKTNEDVRKAIVAFDVGKTERRSAIPLYSALIDDDDGVTYPLSPASGAISSACVAGGKYDAFIATKLYQWDVAAMLVIARESGLVITDVQGQPIDVRNPRMDVVLANPALHAKLLILFRKYATQG